MPNGNRMEFLSLGILVVTFAAACSSAQSDEPGPTATAGSGANPASDAPQVASPLDVSSYVQNPCQLLTVAQLQTIGFTSSTAPSTDDSNPNDHQCAWDDDNTSAHIGAVWQGAFTNGIADLYAKKSELKYFQPVQIGGYPAVVGSESDDRADGTCVVNVGPTNTNEYFIRYSAPNEPQKSRACDIAQKVAGLTIDTLKGGGR